MEIAAAYFAVLGEVDALVFTRSTGGNSPFVRKHCCEGMASLGIAVDDDRNLAAVKYACEIQSGRSQVKVLVIPTNEELEMATQTVECIQTSGDSRGH
jgi:acetate kinase